MEISFKTKKIREICEIQATSLDLFGAENSLRLQNRLADLCAAHVIHDIVVGKPTMIKNGTNTMYQLNFSEDKNILLVANHVNNPINDSGEIDWDLVTRIKIVSIGGHEYDD